MNKAILLLSIICSAAFASDPYSAAYAATREVAVDAVKMSKRVGEGCAIVNIPNAGKCQSFANVSASIQFCAGIVNYELCEGIGGAAKYDETAKNSYTSGSASLGGGQACLDSYKVYVCSLNFPKCVKGQSVKICQSTCVNYFKACKGDTAECTKAGNGISDYIAQGTTGPSDTCTGNSNILLASVLFIAATILAFF